MADDLTLPGTGQDIATDLISGAHYQRVKISQGVDGAATDVSATNPLSVVQQDPNDPTRQAEMDVLHKLFVEIDFIHHAIHDKKKFSIDYIDESLGDDATVILAFKTPAGTKRAYMEFGFLTLVGGDLAVWEGATWDTNTGLADVVIYNHFREAAPAASALLEDKTATPDFTATGNLLSNVTNLGLGGAACIHRQYAWGAQNKFSAGDPSGHDKFILKPDTQYAIVFTADGGSNKAQIELSWDEHTDE